MSPALACAQTPSPFPSGKIREGDPFSNFSWGEGGLYTGWSSPHPLALIWIWGYPHRIFNDLLWEERVKISSVTTNTILPQASVSKRGYAWKMIFLFNFSSKWNSLSPGEKAFSISLILKVRVLWTGKVVRLNILSS